MKLHYRTATKNMWVQRGAHVGAMIGGLLSLIFKPLTVPAKVAWKHRPKSVPDLIGHVVVMCVISGVLFGVERGFEAHLQASPQFIQEAMSPPNRWCVRDWLPRIAKAKEPEPISYADVRRSIKDCKEAYERAMALEGQNQVIQKLNKPVK